MLTALSRRFSSGHTVCLLANSSKADFYGANLMKDIRDKSNGNVKFVGAGGPKMAEQGLEDSLYDMNTYDGKAFHPFRSLDATRWNWWLWAPFNPVTYKHNKPMWDTLKFIEKEDTMNKIM